MDVFIEHINDLAVELNDDIGTLKELEETHQWIKLLRIHFWR